MNGTEAVLSTISAAVTPVVMLSACGTLTISVNNRQQNLTGLIRGAAAESRSNAASFERRAQLHEQIQIWHRRFVCSWLASGALYGAIVFFLATTLGIVWAGRRLSQAPDWVLACFAAGLALMLLASIGVLAEVALSKRTLDIEIRDLELPLHHPGVHHAHKRGEDADERPAP